MSNIRTSLSARSEHYYSPEGTHEVPTFGLDENGEVIVVGSTDLFAEIQSHKEEVLLDKILARCSLTGESLIVSEESFGDSTILPKDLLEAKIQSNSVSDFKSLLSAEDLSLLLEKGFDEFLKFKVNQTQVSESVNSSEVSVNE